MATLTNEPEPRKPALSWTLSMPTSGARVALSRPGDRPKRSFFDVLRSRRSKLGNRAPTEGEISCLIWHSMLLRERRGASDCFLDWESRASPSAGGLHPIQALLLPIDGGTPVGFYDPLRHEIITLQNDPAPLIRANEYSVEKLCGARSGTTIQFVADWAKVQAAYMSGESLLWRDAGALVAIISLVAEACSLAATPLGRMGTELLPLAGLVDARWKAVGAIHIQGACSVE